MCWSRNRFTPILLVLLIEFSTSTPRRAKPSSTVTSDWCRLPQRPEHGLYFVSQRGNSYHQDPSGTYIPHGSVLKYTCDSNYIISTANNNSESTCHHGTWRNMLDCIKLCEPLFSPNAELSCEYGGWVVPCSKPMWPQTKVSVRCKMGYHSQHSEDHGGIECERSGEWNYPIDHCIAADQNKGTPFGMAALEGIDAPLGESFAAAPPLASSQSEPEVDSRSWKCGIPAEQEGHTTLIVDGSPTYPGEYPWLAAIYVRSDNEWSQICGGTVITPRIVLTAAHCLVVGDNRLIAPHTMRVGLGKFHRDYYKEEEHSMIKEVKQLAISPGYNGRTSNYVSDIGLVYLSEEIQTTPYVMPACFDWGGELHLKTGEVGHIAGWGVTENGTASDTILSAQLTYITNSLCRQQIRGPYEKYLTNEKFCGGSNEGSVNNGDSGGGITFKKNNRFYVFGVVSSKISQATTFTLFTDATHQQHHDWVLSERERFKRSH